MRINDLPDDILAPVLQAALVPAKCQDVPVPIKLQTAGVKDGLRLLSVCRRWRELALPMVYGTAFIMCGKGPADGGRPGNVDITIMLELAVEAKRPCMVRRMVIDVRYQDDLFPSLKAVIARLTEVADEWVGVRRLELTVRDTNWSPQRPSPLVAEHEDDIGSISSALAALLPGLREIKFAACPSDPVIRMLFGRLTWFYADQLQVLHSTNQLLVPQDRVFTQLRNISIDGSSFETVEYQPPRIAPEVVESLVLLGFTANDMLSMLCADPDGQVITLPRLVTLNLEYNQQYAMDYHRNHRQPLVELPWIVQFPAAKRVRIECHDVECLAMANAVFPTCLASLEISGRLSLFQAFVNSNVRVSQSLTLRARYESDEDRATVDAISRLFAEAGPCRVKRQAIGSFHEIPLEVITATGLTHLELPAPTSVDDVMEHIRRQPHLVSLAVEDLRVANIQTDLSIPAGAEHEPVEPLDTRITKLDVSIGFGPQPLQLAAAMVTYLLLRIPTLRQLKTFKVPQESIRDFVNEYVQWYPHLAHVELDMMG